MKKILLVISILLLANCQDILSQSENDTTVYLLTCGPGTETYSIYGHSALRVVIPEKQVDNVYNWGVFDFSTPNFAWKFAKGRLNYMLGVATLDQFLQGYLLEKRFVYSQIINLTPEETKTLLSLINENLKPENISYRYDFFYDDCSTRIRDLLEKSIGSSLLYPPEENVKGPTFRDMVGKYQNPYPWLKFGIDLIMGSPGDKRTQFRDHMFLPVDMQNALAEARIRRSEKMIPLLQNPEVILDFSSPYITQKIFSSPNFVFTLVLIMIIILSALLKSKQYHRILDIAIFTLFSIFSILMIFFNFFTDHQQMKWNLNIIWLNPVIPICLIALIFNKDYSGLFRLLFIVSVAFILLSLILPQDFNSAIYPLLFVLIIRSSVRSEFEWNPLSLSSLEST
jgi:hypothetical protein